MCIPAETGEKEEEKGGEEREQIFGEFPMEFLRILPFPCDSYWPMGCSARSRKQIVVPVFAYTSSKVGMLNVLCSFSERFLEPDLGSTVLNNVRQLEEEEDCSRGDEEGG